MLLQLSKKLFPSFIAVVTRAYALVRGRANKPSSKPKTWVVVNLTRNIGDMTCTTPVFHAIKAVSAENRVIVIGTKKNQLMMEHNADIDRYVVYESFWKTVALLRNERVDAGIVINLGALDFALLFLARVRAIATFTMGPTYNEYQSRAYLAVAHLGILVPYTPGVYVPGQYVTLLAPFGIHGNGAQKHLGYSKEARERIDQELEDAGIPRGHRVVALAPGAGTKVKQWPADRFARIAEHLVQTHDVGIVIIGGPGDAAEIGAMKASLTSLHRIADCAHHSLDELKATLSRVTLIIGNDSGPIYVAESFGAGTIVLVGPTDETEHPLQDATHRVVKSRPDNAPLMQSHLLTEDSIDHGVALSQMAAISVEQVAKEIDDVMKRLV